MRPVLRMLMVVSVVIGAPSASAAQDAQATPRDAARQAFRDGSVLYTERDYLNASARFAEALRFDPSLTSAYFYLANCYDNLYKPSRRGEPANDYYLTQAIEYYRLAVDRSEDPKLRKLARQYLVACYGPDKLDRPLDAVPLLQAMIAAEPGDTANYFALSKVYENAGDHGQAEATLMKARDARPDDGGVYGQLAGFYNRRRDVQKTVEMFERRAAVEPNSPEAYYTLAAFYWDKAFRGAGTLPDSERRYLVLQGLQYSDQALGLRPDYVDALVNKGLLLRIQASMEKDPAKYAACMKEAQELANRAKALRVK